MGKSNRIRKDRANATLTTVKTHKKKQGMPSWALNLITILVAAVILFSVAFSLLSANGVFTRMQTAMKTENFRVDANMMKYYFQTQYSNFVSQNSSYLSSIGLDTSVSLKEQTVSTGEDSQTWFDYMMAQTEAQVKEMLAYCEEAETRGLSLDDAAKESIDAEIEMIETYAEMYGYTTNAYIAQIYGKGVKESDVRNCLELNALAQLCAATVGDEVEGGISEEDIVAEYDANKQDYDLVDMLSYTFTVSYSTVKAECGSDADEATVIAKYKEKIAEAKAKAEALKSAEDEEAFKSLLADYILDTTYDDEFKEADSDTDLAVEASDKPTAENADATVKAAIVAQLKTLILEDKDFSADDIAKDNKVGELELTEKYAAFIKKVAQSVYTSANTAFDTANEEGKNYSESDEGIKWAFDDARAEGDKNIFETGDKDIADDAKAADLKSYSVETIYLVKKEHRDEAPTKDVAVMVFSSEESAKSALEKLSAGMTLEAFESVATEAGGTYSNYENYTEGSLGVADFDTWLYKTETVVGSYTTEIIEISGSDSSSSSYVLALYHADGDAEWHVSVKGAIYSERYAKKVEEITAAYSVTVNEKVITKIDA